MINIFSKIKYFFTKPKVIIIAGNAQKPAAQAIIQVLQRSFRLGKDLLVYQLNSGRIKDFEFLIKHSTLPILVATHAGEYHYEREFFAAKESQVYDLAKLTESLPVRAQLLLNFDDETVRDLKNKSRAHVLTFGFGARADIQASDVVLTQSPGLGTNFKINYQGNIVPIWLPNLFGKEHIYAALAAVAVGEILDLNLVEISTSLKLYQGFLGRMKLIEGIKNTLILDDSESASPLSMAEGLDVLKKIELPADKQGRKIAVLGDIIGFGQYVPETHEAIGEEAKSSADLLFTVGPRAKFFAEGAKKKGMLDDKIFSFDKATEAGLALQKEIKEGDLILVDGSQEIQMGKVTKEIRAIKQLD